MLFSDVLVGKNKYQLKAFSGEIFKLHKRGKYAGPIELYYIFQKCMHIFLICINVFLVSIYFWKYVNKLLRSIWYILTCLYFSKNMHLLLTYLYFKHAYIFVDIHIFLICIYFSLAYIYCILLVYMLCIIYGEKFIIHTCISSDMHIFLKMHEYTSNTWINFWYGFCWKSATIVFS